MLNVRFYINKQKVTKHKDHPVYMSITFNGQRIRRPVSGVHVAEKSWDDEKERIKSGSRLNQFDEIRSFNNRIDQIEAQLKLIQQTAFDKRLTLTEKYILERLEDESLIKADNHDFFKVVDLYMAAIRSVKAKATMDTKKSDFDFLRRFEKEYSYKLSLNKMDLEFFEIFRRYSFEDRKIGDNTFAKTIRTLKSFLNWAFERDYIREQHYKKFKAPERYTEIICLTLGEFTRLYNHTFESKRLEYVRDVFIFGCSTGLRFSDLKALKSSNVHEDFIVFNTQKTSQNNTVPLNKYSKEILKKYKGTVQEPLPRISHQKFNVYIKLCCKEVEIDTPTTLTRFSGGTRTEETYPKWELITSHAARKTFTTLNLLLGVSERVVKGITGHKNEESFKRYVNFTKEYEKKQMDDVWDKI
jgi:integrase